MRDLEIEVRVRNNQLKERRLALGFSQKEMGALIGSSQRNYGAFETMRRSPITCVGDWTDVAKKLGRFFDVDPADGTSRYAGKVGIERARQRLVTRESQTNSQDHQQ